VSPIDRYLHAVLVRAEHEAREDGSRTIEAQHMFLAVAAEPEPVVSELLASAGLDRAAVQAAVEQEFVHSLSVVGVSSSTYDLPKPSRMPTHPGLGTSAKLALERGLGAALRKKELRPAHVLLGILSAQAGPVPRALDLAGVDREALRDRVTESLA
jgi:ATP-dependent Clp protease ATP-binding subunit ClpA